VADVIDAVGFARTHGLAAAVRGGGHGVAGHATCDGGLLIDLSAMKGIDVDPVARRARVQGGVTWGELDRETQLFGLATPGGNVSTTGVGGLTLGGGMGHLRNRHGLSIDNLLSVDVVTADGGFVRASETENEELFWGIRGGGGNFGVVTSFEFRLHPVGPTVGLCAPFYPAEMAGEVFRFWRSFVDTMPDELSSTVAIWTVPAVPGFPEEARGKDVVIPIAVWCGPPDEWDEVTRPLRRLGTPLADQSGPIAYGDLQRAFDPFLPKGDFYYFKSLRLERLDDGVIDAVVARALEKPSPRTFVPIWHHGGAVRRVGADETAYGDRSAPFLLSIDAVWERAEATEENLAWSRSFWQEMRAHSSSGPYLIFAGPGEEREELVRAAYGSNYRRLVELKARYDPLNLFRLNQNIPPGG
jgi:FAD/FMN-containing dehydrogenase